MITSKCWRHQQCKYYEKSCAVCGHWSKVAGSSVPQHLDEKQNG